MRNLNEDSFPRLEKLDRMGYVQFLSDWSDAGSDRAAGRLNNYLATIHMESCLEITKIDDSDGGGVDPTTLRRNTEEVLLQENTFSLEDVSPVVKCLSGCLMPEGPGLGPCSPMVHDAFLHVLLDKGGDISSSGHLQPEGSGVNVGSLLGTVQASEFCGAFVLLMFHRCSVVRDWAWATILNLSTDGEGLLTRGEDEKCTIRLSLFTLKLLCALRHIFRVPLIIDNGDVRTILLGGFCRIVSIVTSLGLSLETIKRLLREKYAERPNQQDSSAVSCSGEAKPLEFPGDISKRVIETLGGGALIHWLLTNAHTRSSESIPPVTTESLATEISALLEAEEKKHSGKLKGKTQRCLAEIILAAILVNAKGAGEFEGSSRGVWHRQRLQELWQFASRIVAPPSGSSAVADNASPVRTDSWILRTLIGKLLELLGIETVVRSAKYFRGDSTSPEFRTMEVAVYVINSVLTSLSDTLPENAVSMHYYELLKSLQEDVRHLLIAVARHTSDIRQVLGLLKHFLLADIVRHGTGDGMHPEGSLRAVWDSYITMIGQATENIKRDSEGQTPAPAVQKLLLLFEVLSVFIDYPNVYNALLKCPQSKTDEPGDLASTLRRCVGRLLVQVSRLSKSVGRPQPSTQVDAVGGTTDSRRSSNGTLGAAIPADSISDSRVPLLMNVFILSTDPSLRFIGRRIMDLFCGTLDPTMQSALRSNAATWLTREVLLKEDIADNNMLTLDDTKVGDAVRAEGATWANVMAACDWPAVPGGVPLEAWWLCAQVLNLSTLERDVSSRLLSNVVHKLPPITSPDERTTRGGKKCLPLQSSATAHPAGGNHVVYIDSSTSSNSSASDAEMDQDNRISEGIGSEGASSCRLSLPMLHQCAQRLFLALLHNNAVSPPASFAKAILHVATQLKGLPLPETFTKKVRVALFGMYRRFWKESYAVLLDLSPPWLTAILHEVGREFNNRMIERRARERQAGVEEKYQQLMEVERNELDRRDASVLRANIDIRERELRRQRRLTTTANHDEVEIGIKRRRENSPALMIAQELPATTYSPVAAPQARQYDGQRGLPVARSVSAVNRCGSDIRSAPPHVRSTNERMLNEFKRIESATSCHEAIRRVAGCTDLGHCAPLIDDIIGLEPTCLAPEVPIIPVRFPSDKRNGFAKYISSFFPHIVLGMRYELYNCFDEVLKAAQSRWNPGTTRPVLDTIYDGGAGHVDSACGGRDNNGSSDPCDTHTGGGATRTNEIVQSVKWVTEKATTALCPGNVTVRGMDVPQVLFNVMLLPGNGDGRYHPKMNSFFSEGDAALLLFPLDVMMKKLPGVFEGCSVPPSWATLGCMPQICIITALQPNQGAAAVTVFTPKAAKSRHMSEDGLKYPEVIFLHVLRVFIDNQKHFYIKRLSSLASSFATASALFDIQRKSISSTLLQPRMAAHLSKIYAAELKKELFRSDIWTTLSKSILLLGELDEHQARAVTAALVALIPGWEKKVLPRHQEASPSLPLPPDITIIEGPPGTGKTQTIAVLTANLIHSLPPGGQRVLLCASSNRAIDEVLLRLLKLIERAPKLAKFRLLRVGVRENIDDEVLAKKPPLFLDDLVSVAANNLQAQGTCRSSVETAVMQSYEAQSGNFNSTGSSRARLREDLVRGAGVVFTTVGSLSQLHHYGLEFDAVIVDEASQCPEPDILAALVLSRRRAVLVGDSRQLQPTILCQASAERGMQRSLLQRLLHNDYDPFTLLTQYRMHPSLCAFPNQFFYRGKLITHKGIIARRCPMSSDVPCQISERLAKLPRLIFVDVRDGYMENSARTKFQGSLISNKREAEIVAQQARYFRKFLQLSPSEFAKRAGIITFYRGQKEAIVSRLHYEERKSGLQVATADSFQGKERDFIFISCVRAPTYGAERSRDHRGQSGPSLGFLQDWHRINVALTRAKEFCVVFGHRQTFIDSAVAHRFKRDAKAEDNNEDVFCEGTLLHDENPLVFDHLFEYAKSHPQDVCCITNEENMDLLRCLLQMDGLS